MTGQKNMAITNINNVQKRQWKHITLSTFSICRYTGREIYVKCLYINGSIL